MQTRGFPTDGDAHIAADLAPRYGAGDQYTQQPGGFVTAAIDTETGARDWTASYRTPHASGSVAGTAIAASPTGDRVYVTGLGWCGVGVALTCLLHWTHAAVTVAYDATDGAQDWVAVDFDHQGMTSSIAVAPDGGRVYVAGDAQMDQTSSRFVMAVRAYDADVPLL